WHDNHSFQTFFDTSSLVPRIFYHVRTSFCFLCGRVFMATCTKVIIQLMSSHAIPASTPPPIHAIDRWWGPRELEYLCHLKSAIENQYPHASEGKNLLLIAFCRLLIQISNASFNHQSISFKDTKRRQMPLFSNVQGFDEMFLRELDIILESANYNPPSKTEVVYGDSRNVAQYVSGKYNLLITSPPYPNRISYIRELRPYMYWLGYLKEGKEAGELDWEAIGGTWGIATSRLSKWKKSSKGYYPLYYVHLLDKISDSGNKNGYLMANYIARYFEDIWNHLQSVIMVLSPGSKVHYIVGNSSFYGIQLPVEQIYRDMLEALKFKNVCIKPIRKRNSKKTLFEYDVTACWA
ncbi:MAG: hypothetical protein AB1611_15865, partial [bacterium]